MKERKLVFAVLAVFLLAFVVTSTPVKGDRTDVKMYVWDTTSNSDTYPWKAYGTTPALQTFVQVWIDAPDAWTDTAIGIVSWKVKLQVDPTQVQSVNALQYADSAAFPDGIPDDFLGLYLSLYVGSGSLLWAPPIINDTLGTIEAGEAIAGFGTLGKGSGGDLTDIEGNPFPTTPSGDRLIPLVRFQIRTREGVTGPGEGIGSFLDLTEAIYVTIDEVQHPVEVVVGGRYGAPVIPEFPFGPGVIMIIATAIAAVCIWRIRKKTTKQ
jgi:hypothetical protein